MKKQTRVLRSSLRRTAVSACGSSFSRPRPRPPYRVEAVSTAADEAAEAGLGEDGNEVAGASVAADAVAA